MRIFWLSFILIITIGLCAGFVTSLNSQLPDIATLDTPIASTQLLDCNGKIFFSIHGSEDRIPVKLNAMPKNLTDAVVAIEDERFYSHNGVDIIAIARAIFSDLFSMSIAEGGSTITQQLARNALLSHEQTFLRKLKEVLLALKIERKYSKSEILQMYINQVYFGHGVYGVQAAAKEYFNKNAADLTLSECAYLAGVPQSPNYYSDSKNRRQALERMNLVLGKMLEQKFINQTQKDNAEKTPPGFIISQTENSDGYFSDYVTEQIVERYGADAIYRDGLIVYTTINSDYQRAAEKALKKIPVSYLDAHKLMQPQVALVCIDNKNGQIRALIGGRGTDQFNRAILAKRQPGSAIKPFVYYTALNAGMTPDSLVDDQPVSYAGYAPGNYDNKFHGQMKLRTALANSYNTIAVQLTARYGITNIQKNIKAAGITTLVETGPVNDNNLALALGGMTDGVIPLEMAEAYSTIANYGKNTRPSSIIRITDRNQKKLFEQKSAAKQALDKKSCIALINMMEDVLKIGTGTAAAIDRPAAGKTGTTSNHNDAWFCGFTPEYTTIIWMGNDDNQTLGKLTGGDYPAQVWHDFMLEITKGTLVTKFLTNAPLNSPTNLKATITP
ncbi:MAG: PBP1A family penicillin-binding protein [Negativicutes bacterium]|jgi:penicillin-binding protein 1A